MIKNYRVIRTYDAKGQVNATVHRRGWFLGTYGAPALPGPSHLLRLRFRALRGRVILVPQCARCLRRNFRQEAAQAPLNSGNYFDSDHLGAGCWNFTATNSGSRCALVGDLDGDPRTVGRVARGVGGQAL